MFAPSDRSRTTTGVSLSFAAASSRVEIGHAEVDRPGDRVAERGAVVGLERAQPFQRLGAVVRRRHDDVGLVGERDDADAEPIGQVLDEGARRLSGRGHAVGRDVGRQHRAGAVHGEDHGRLLARDIHGHLRPRDSDHERREREQSERRGDVAPPAGRGRDDVLEQIQVREADDVLPSPALRDEVREEGEPDDDQAQQGEGPAEAHLRLPSVAAKPTRRRNQSPDVDRVRCDTPAERSSRVSDSRSASASAAKRSRSLRLRVSTRS